MPLKKVIIHDIFEFKESEFFENVVKNTIAIGAQSQVKNLRFLWSNGIVLNATEFPNTPDIIREKMQGVQHYEKIEYVPMPEYKKESIVRIDNQPYPIAIVKNNIPLLDDIAKYLTEKKYLEVQRQPKIQAP